MPPPLTRDVFATPEGRRRAWRELMLSDHGVLRKLYDNTHRVDERLWRSYQPSPAKLEWFAKRGVKTVINLRGAADVGHYRLEEEACARLGLKLVDFRAYSREAPSKEFVCGIKEVFEAIEYPAMMHCKSGADRTGVTGVLYKHLIRGEPMEAAMEQLSFRRYGHLAAGKTGVIDYAFRKYIQWRDETGGDFLAWVDEVHDPAETKKEFMGSWWGNLLTEKLLRRE